MKFLLAGKFLTIAEAAALRGVSRWAIDRWIRGGLPAQRLGRERIIARSDLDAFTPQGAGNPGKKRK
jgi:excisionase family DNA binding protein